MRVILVALRFCCVYLVVLYASIASPIESISDSTNDEPTPVIDAYTLEQATVSLSDTEQQQQQATDVHVEPQPSYQDPISATGVHETYDPRVEPIAVSHEEPQDVSSAPTLTSFVDTHDETPQLPQLEEEKFPDSSTIHDVDLERERRYYESAESYEIHNGTNVETAYDTMVDEWSTQMNDFIPDMLVTFRLASRSDEYFYQEFGPKPTLVRGGYFVSGDNTTGPINFSVVDGKGEVVVNERKSEGLFRFTSSTEGTYAFVLANNDWITPKFVTFVVGAGNQTTLNVEHVNSIQENVQKMARMVQDVHSESQYLWSRQRGRMDMIKSTHSRTFWLSVLELVTVCIVTVVQVYVLKGLVSHQRMF